jgi:hypothetical protein
MPFMRIKIHGMKVRAGIVTDLEKLHLVAATYIYLGNFIQILTHISFGTLSKSSFQHKRYMNFIG